MEAATNGLLMRFNPTEEQKIEIIKLVMNYNPPMKPDGVQTQCNVSWEMDGMRFRMDHNKTVGSDSPFVVEATTISSNTLRFIVSLKFDKTFYIELFDYLGNDTVVTRYLFVDNIIKSTKYIDEASRKSILTPTKYIETFGNGCIETSGKIDTNGFLYKKYQEGEASS
jgi:hypothetical protein